MRKLSVHNHMSLDGFIADGNSDMSWAQRSDPEWLAFMDENASGESAFLFGRVTYQLMASYWPTPQAIQTLPVIAKRMNQAAKYVFSRTLRTAAWENTALFSGDLEAETRKLKQASGPDIMIFGSGTIVAQLARAGLVDAIQLVVNPLALGSGRGMFAGVEPRLPLRLEGTRTFKNGNVVLSYVPARP